jgi:hypothetical protein
MPQKAWGERDERGQNSTTGTGSPSKKLADRSLDELRNRARKLGIEGRSSMTKSEIIAAITKERMNG